ncbi:MAG: type II toxin-antitoxin system YafQ family toxin [Desulfobacterales bacterium]|nr:type II toxin-antitoxin system YafQ family toxin [Desulfobacterales bacterium]
MSLTSAIKFLTESTKLKDIIKCLANAEKLSPRNKDHQLKGTLKDCRE